MIDVLLTAEDLMLAALAGARQQAENVGAGRRDNHGFEGDGWAAQIEGLASEIAVARAVDRFHNPIRPFALRARADVGRLHVRSTDRHDGRLILHDTDAPGTYVLVIRSLPRCRIVGTFEKQGELDRRWWREDVRNPAYFVPQRDLTPARELWLVA